MKYSKLFPKTLRAAPAGTELEGQGWLYRAGYIDQLLAGVYTLLPLGWRVAERIKQIIREEMNAVGGQEMSMPVLQPKELWQETGRWESLKGAMFQLKDKSDKDLGLAFTHEEVATDLVRRHGSSYKDFPISIYHFATKLRDEPRSRGGLIRVREFIMKDLYSFHTSAGDLDSYYDLVAAAYLKTFKRLGLSAKQVEAAGGVFTEEHSHEYQVLTDVGEDTVYYCQKCDFAQNKEIAEVAEGDKCPKCGGLVAVSRSIEVGNIFKYRTSQSEKMAAKFTDKDGQEKLVHMASYGIGIGRALGTIAEIYHDERGLAWPEPLAPFKVHLVSLNPDNLKVSEKSLELEKKLEEKGLEVLYDDREESAGVKLADADMIGIPWRVIISPKSLAAGGVEVKKRSEDKSEVMTQAELLRKLS
jgi:prolyl-tRNA synthetase